MALGVPQGVPFIALRGTRFKENAYWDFSNLRADLDGAFPADPLSARCLQARFIRSFPKPDYRFFTWVDTVWFAFNRRVDFDGALEKEEGSEVCMQLRYYNLFYQDPTTSASIPVTPGTSAILSPSYPSNSGFPSSDPGEAPLEPGEE